MLTNFLLTASTRKILTKFLLTGSTSKILISFLLTGLTSKLLTNFLLTGSELLFALVDRAGEISEPVSQHGFASVDVGAQDDTVPAQHLHKSHASAGHLAVVEMLDGQPQGHATGCVYSATQLVRWLLFVSSPVNC